MRRLLLALALLASAAAWAQYPAKPVKVVVPFPPGGPTDVVGRFLAQKLGEQTGQNFLVENRAGGNATIGANEVAKSAADGYTLLFNANIFTITPLISKNVPYDVQRDFTPVSLVAKGPIALAVNPGLPAANVAELVAHAKANPGKLAFAIGSMGSAGHLATEFLKRSAGIDLLIVPYKGSTPAYQDLLGGQIHGFMDPVLGAQPHWRAGKVRVLAVTSLRRLPAAPDTPTVAETLPGFEIYAWYGLWGPANLPREITAKLSAEVNKALTSDLRERLLAQGYELAPGTPEEFARFQREDVARSARIVADAKITAQ
ncbi:MAG: tripartite tricarboxylate transporter substrate binding protein [Betaproteobacteria bacterium]|nr:tripartite tricarboxylate transporter substrate binding protein [Betaproteobacteria bacterium]